MLKTQINPSSVLYSGYFCTEFNSFLRKYIQNGLVRTFRLPSAETY